MLTQPGEKHVDPRATGSKEGTEHEALSSGSVPGARECLCELANGSLALPPPIVAGMRVEPRKVAGGDPLLCAAASGSDTEVATAGVGTRGSCSGRAEPCTRPRNVCSPLENPEEHERGRPIGVALAGWRKRDVQGRGVGGALASPCAMTPPQSRGLDRRRPLYACAGAGYHSRLPRPASKASANLFRRLAKRKMHRTHARCCAPLTARGAATLKVVKSLA